MGFFGTYRYDGRTWATHELDTPVPTPEPWLVIDIHDSDITTVWYRPTGPGGGVAYLGSTPRTYFENEAASAPTDVDREAAGLLAWTRVTGTNAGTDAVVTLDQIRGHLAVDEDDVGWDEGEDVDALDDAEVFVEVRTIHFLTVLGLPLPVELAALEEAYRRRAAPGHPS